MELICFFVQNLKCLFIQRLAMVPVLCDELETSWLDSSSCERVSLNAYGCLDGHGVSYKPHVYLKLARLNLIRLQTVLTYALKLKLESRIMPRYLNLLTISKMSLDTRASGFSLE